MRQEQVTNLTIAEAILATLATPPLFDSVSISKDAAKFEYIGADLVLSNPARQVIAEAHMTFGSAEQITCIVSVGCGHPGLLSTPQNLKILNWSQFLERLVTDAEREAQSLDSHMGHLGVYHRFCVDKGLEKTEDTTTSDPGNIITHTCAYLADISVSRQLDLCVDSLKLREGIVSLGQLSKAGNLSQCLVLTHS
jgi:hypothetical protein